jgi:anti-sigma regulatory factor (Ser/Thr protein kinase)
MLRDAIGAEAYVYMPSSALYTLPALAIASCRQLLAAHVRAGAEQIRIAGEVPHPGTGRRWDQWARYEAAINEMLDDFPLWGLCSYDTRLTPADILADIVCTHPHIASTDGSHSRNAHYVDPQAYLAGRVRHDLIIDVGPPHLTLADPSPRDARRAVVALAFDSRLTETQRDNLGLAVSEIVSNAVSHGVRPVSLRAWAEHGRCLVEIREAGPGPSDPLVGLLPTLHRNGVGGRGLWIAHQLCEIDQYVADGAFVTRLQLSPE